MDLTVLTSYMTPSLQVDRILRFCAKMTTRVLVSLWETLREVQGGKIRTVPNPILVTARRCYSTGRQKMKFDTIKLNRWFLQQNGTLYPWKFDSTSTGRHYAVSRRNILHSAIFKVQLAFCTLYTLYIQWTLVEHTIRHGLDTRRYHMFGAHLIRSMLAMTFSFWGYEFFVAHADGQKVLL